MSTIELSRIDTDEEMQQALSVRRRVFVEEQGVSIDEEVDGYDADPAKDPRVVHVLGCLDGTPIATARLLIDVPPGELPHIGRVAVLAEHRRRGYGAAVMRWLEEEARRRGFPGVTLAAQLHAIPFYESLGYVAHGPVFLDAGIKHRDMDLRWG